MAQFPKGKSGNPKGAPKKVKDGEILSFGFSEVGGVPDIPVPIFQNTNVQPYKWIPFGADNLFPQAIAQLTRKSPSHRGILNWKTIYCSGKGFQSENKELETYIADVNANGESLKSIAKKMFFDRFSGGNSYIEIVKPLKGDLNVLNLYHRDHTTCRVSHDEKNILIHGNWTLVNSMSNKITSIPIYPVFEEGLLADGKTSDGYLHSIFHYKSYEPEFSDYGIPDWIAAMDAAAIAYKTNKWNVSRLDNSFQSSGTLIVEGNITPAEAKKLKADFKKEFTGEQKQGKIMLIIKQLGTGTGGGGGTTFTPISTPAEGDWLKLHTQSDQDLLIAHNWFRSLCGMSETGKLGNTIQIRNEYQIASKTIIADEQEGMLEVLKKIISEQSKIVVDDLQFVNEAPISMYDIDVNATMKVWEARKIQGLPFDENDATQQMYISQNGPTKTATPSNIPGAND